VQGFASTDSGTIFMVTTPEGISVSVSSSNGPDWMKVGSLTARMLV